MADNDFRFFGHGYVTRGRDPKLPPECLICIEAAKGAMTAYARPGAFRAAHLKAANYAQEKTESVVNEEYIDYYMLHYRVEYRKIYSEFFEKYRIDYYNKLLEKTYTDTDKICEFHKYSIKSMASMMV